MEKEVQIFRNSEFGEIRIIEENGIELFCGKDIASALGYAIPRKAITDHCRKRGVLKRSILTNGGKQIVLFIDEGNLYRLITHSRLETAEKFESWVFDEVLPTIRKTGSYNIRNNGTDFKEQMLKTRQDNAKVRQAQLMYKLSKDIKIESYRQVLQSYITELLTGEKLIPLPMLEQKTYSATEVADRLGISANMLGRIVNSNNLKTEQYGVWCWDKAKNCDKQVQTFRYYDSIVNKVKMLLMR